MLDYIDGTVSDTEKHEIENHLEKCESCLDELMHSQKVLNLISRGEQAKPEESLQINFYHMLYNEIKKIEGSSSSNRISHTVPWHNRLIFKIAAGILLMVCGTTAGLLIHIGTGNSKRNMELTQLRSEVDMLKKTAMYAMLNNESSSNRIQAVDYADEIRNPDKNIIDALVITLNSDKNINVRMAAAYALSKFANRQSVSDSLVRSLSLQNDPIVQITLINILVEHRQKSAVKPIENLMNASGTMDEVKTVAEKGLKKLL